MTHPHQADGGGSRFGKWFTWISITVAIIALGVTVASVGLDTILNNLRTIGWWFALIIGLEMIITACDAAALAQFLAAGNENEQPVRYRHVLAAQLAARAVNAVTPGGNLGEATKTTMLLDKAKAARVIAAVLRYNLITLFLSLGAIAIGGAITGLVVDLPQAMQISLLIGAAAAALVIALLVWLVKRGLSRSFVALAGHLRLLSRARRQRWKATLEDIDTRLLPRKVPSGSRRRADLRARLGGGVAWLLVSRLLSWTNVWIVLAAAGQTVSPGFLAVIVTAGVLIGWVSSLVPMGIGLSESGNYALFSALGANPALGVTMVLARRVTTLIYAAVGLVLIVSTEAVKRSRKLVGRRGGARARQPAPGVGS